MLRNLCHTLAAIVLLTSASSCGGSTGAKDGDAGTEVKDGGGDMVFGPGGTGVWGRGIGNPFRDGALSVAVNAVGHTYVLASSIEEVKMEGPLIPTPVHTGVYLAKLDAKGAHLWSRYLPLTDGTVALTAEGEPVVVGGSSSAALFVAALDGAGKEKWTRSFAASSSDDMGPAVRARGVVGPTGDIGVALELSGSMVLGGEFYGGFSGGTHTSIAAVLDPTGKPRWTHKLASGAVRDLRVGFLPSGRLVVAGTSGNDVSVVVFTPEGATVWTRNWSGGIQALEDMGIDGEGSLLLGQSDAPALPTGGPDPMLTVHLLRKVSAAGVDLWSRSFDVVRLTLAVTPSTDVLVAGVFTKPVDLGAGSLVPTKTSDAFVARLGPDGLARWSRRLGFQFAWTVDGVALGAGSVVFVGSFDRDWAFDTGTIRPTTFAGSASPPETDVFVGRLAW